MRANPVALVSGALAVGAVLAGFATISSPGAARLEKFDRNMAAGMTDLVRTLECRGAARLPERLPDDVDPETLRSFCGDRIGAYLVWSGARPNIDKVRYRRLSDTEFELCAEFHDLSRVEPHLLRTVDPETGCMTGRLGG